MYKYRVILNGSTNNKIIEIKKKMIEILLVHNIFFYQFPKSRRGKVIQNDDLSHPVSANYKTFTKPCTY